VTSVTENSRENEYQGKGSHHWKARLRCSYVWSYNDFEWDEAKSRTNIRKHGLDFADAQQMFRGSVIAEPDTRDDYGEKRWVGLGLIHGRVTHIVFTEREGDVIRIISLRKATRREREQYEKAIQDRLETG
jgi:uncharacterized DUF497 family protein